MAKTYIVPQNTPALVQGGLTPGQAGLYETLVQYGSLNARRAGFLSGIPRTLAYKILGELESLGLVVKKELPGAVATFSPVNPLRLKEIGDKKFEEAQTAKKALDEAVFKLVSDFSRVSGHPDVQVLRGTAALTEFLEDQLAQKGPVVTTVLENSPTKLTISVIFEAI